VKSRLDSNREDANKGDEFDQLSLWARKPENWKLDDSVKGLDDRKVGEGGRGSSPKQTSVFNNDITYVGVILLTITLSVDPIKVEGNEESEKTQSFK
jgi:hypothetical protein